MLVSILSSKPELLGDCLSAYSSLSPKSLFLVINPEKIHSVNAKTISKIGCDCIHVSEESFTDSAFQGFGGLRNIALLHAVKEKKDCVFFDDDTLPAANPLARYEELFSQGKEIICGKYLKHSGGSTALLLSLIDSLKKNSSQAESFLNGIPIEASEAFESSGLVGGNMGVSLKVARTYCFFPTTYRVEDGSFGFLAKYYGFQVFNSTRMPLVIHSKQPAKNALFNNLVSEARGSVVSLSISDYLNGLTVNKEDKAKLVFKNFLLPYFKEKTSKLDLDEFGKQVREQVQRIRALTEKDFIPKDFEKQFDLFFKTQASWKKIV